MTPAEWRKYWQELRKEGVDVDELRSKLHNAKMRDKRKSDVEVARARDKKYYESHKEKRAATMKAYGQRNRAELSRKHHEYVVKNRDKINARRRANRLKKKLEEESII